MASEEVLHKLHRSALRAAGGHIFGLLATCACLHAVWPAAVIFRWFLAVSVVLGYVHFQLFSNLGQNHPPPAGKLRPSLGTANGITLARGFGACCLAGFVLLPGDTLRDGTYWIPWTTGLLYLCIGGADFMDGFWARRTRSESVLGQRLDVEMDALGLLAASALAVRMGRLPLFYLMVGASYYLFKIGIRYRRHSGKTVLPLKFRRMARISAGLNMGFAGAALLPVFSEKGLRPAAVCFSIPLLAGFLWDWLQVSARLTDAAAHRVQKTFEPGASILPPRNDLKTHQRGEKNATSSGDSKHQGY